MFGHPKPKRTNRVEDNADFGDNVHYRLGYMRGKAENFGEIAKRYNELANLLDDLLSLHSARPFLMENVHIRENCFEDMQKLMKKQSVDQGALGLIEFKLWNAADKLKENMKEEQSLLVNRDPSLHM